MKKFLVILIVLMMATPAFARGIYGGVFASWYQVTTATTITPPENSRDIFIRNGSSATLYVSLKGNTISTQTFVSASPTTPDIIELDGDSEIYLSDFVTGSIILMAPAVASPVTVVITY